jgi:alpha-soluble NSF attachment protein
MSGRGEAFLAEGEKALNRKSIISVFFGGSSSNFEEAAEAFVKAGNAFKLASSWQSAGDAFMKAANAHSRAASTDEVNSYVEAANCYKKINPVDAVNAYQQAIQLYNNNGRFGMSARYNKELAELYEADNNMDSAMSTYQEAARLFSMDNKKSNANQCSLKVASFASEHGNFAQAAEIFEDVGKEAMSTRLGSYSAKGYFFQCLLCLLAAGDM